MPKKGLPHHHIKRAFSKNFRAVEAFETESGYGEIHTEGEYTRAYMLWRHSALWLLCVFFGIAAVLMTTNLILELKDSKKEVDNETDRALRRVYDSYYKAELGITIIEIIELVACWVMMALALFKWKLVRKPAMLLSVAWIITFSMPFILHVFPYRKVVSMDQLLKDSGVYKEDLTLLCDAAKLNNDEDSCSAIVSIAAGGCPRNCADLYDLLESSLDVFLGARFGVETLKKLAPTVLSLFPGIQAGAITVKALLPGHPLPGFVAFIKPIVYVPLVWTLVSSVYQTIGDQYLGIALAFVVLAEVCFLVFGRPFLNSIDDAQFKKASKRISISSKVCYLLALVFVIIFLLVNKRFFELLKMLGKAIAEYELKPLQIITMIIKTLANFFLTRLVFSNIVLVILAKERVEILKNENSVQPHVDDAASLFGFVASNSNDGKAAAAKPSQAPAEAPVAVAAPIQATDNGADAPDAAADKKDDVIPLEPHADDSSSSSSYTSGSSS